MSGSVVVTGLGTLGPWGGGAAALASALARGTIATREVDRSAGWHVEGGARRAGLVPDDAYGAWLPPARARRMSPPSRAAVTVALMALDDARLSAADAAGDGTAVALGTAFGCTTFTAQLLRQLAEQGPEAMSPFLFMETVANAHAGQIALAVGARGASYTITQREASALLAVLRGRDLLLAGRARVVLAGAVDEMGPLLHAVLDRFGALARADEDREERARPLDAHRAGFVAAEGSTVLVLEEESAARARGARVLARIRAGARANDPSATASDWGEGGGELGLALRAQLARAGVDARSIQAVASGASGSRRGDRAEAAALRACFAGEPPPIVAPKAATGEYGGGFLAAALLAVGGARVAARPDFTRDAELGLAPREHALDARRWLVSSLAAGGAAAWMVLERAEP